MVVDEREVAPTTAGAPRASRPATARRRRPRAAAAWSAPESPSERRLTSFDVVVEEADQRARERRAEDRRARGSVAPVDGSRTASTTRSPSARRPSWACPPCRGGAAARRRGRAGRTALRRRNSMNFGDGAADDQRDGAADRTACHLAPPSFAATASSPPPREPLTSTMSPGRSSPAQQLGRLAASGRRRGSPDAEGLRRHTRARAGRP